MATTTRALTTRAPILVRVPAARRRTSYAVARRARPRKRSWINKVHLPLAVAAGFLPVTKDAIDLFQGGGLRNVAKYLPKRFIPYDFNTGHWTMDKFMVGTGSIILGILVHKYVGGKLGVNKALASAGIPFIRL